VLRSAHDVSDGGLACCLAESSIAGGVGATVDLAPLLHRERIDAETGLFGEGPGGIVVSASRDALMQLSNEAAGVGFLALGTVGGDELRIAAGDGTIDMSIEEAGRLFDSALADRLS
jgi:phosphoribosylformylglycinamidine (FGAM) synthase-like enzyme